MKNKKTLTTIPVITLLGISGYAFMNQSKFGKKPTGKRMKKIRNSPHFKDGQFHNLSPTPSFTEGANYLTVLKKFFFEREERAEPKNPIPSVKTDLKILDASENILVWFGHSSYFLQIDGKRILVDPVFSGHASPVSFSNKSFKGTNVYKAEDIPQIDYLFISHDHWDHLDYDSIKELKPKIKKVITGLGTGTHLESWGYDPDRIIEKDWNEEVSLEKNFKVFTTPARHFSGRGFKRNSVLWTSFVLITPNMKIYIGGDSGYDSHFKEIGDRFGPFDLAVLENGQFNKHWKYIHMMPEQTLQAAKDLQTEKLVPVHNSKFALAKHPWDQPLKAITDLYRKEDKFQLLTPIIGEKVDLNRNDQKFTKWWEEVD